MTDLPAARSSDSTAPWPAPVVRERAEFIPWWTSLILGAASVLFGGAVLVWPKVSLALMAVLLGCWLLVAGAVRIVGAFLPGTGLGRHLLSGITGVILLVGGALCLRDLASSLAVIALLVALSWIFSGLSGIVMAMQAEAGGRAWLLTTGLLSLVIGLAFLFTPRLSLAVLVVTTGISAIILGAGELVVAYQLRKSR